MKYVRITFANTRKEDFVGKVETELDGPALEESIAVPTDKMQLWFGEDWQWWEIEEVTQLTTEEATDWCGRECDAMLQLVISPAEEGQEVANELWDETRPLL